MRQNVKSFYFIVVVCFLFLAGCTDRSEQYILISREYKTSIRSWLSDVDDHFVFINMYTAPVDSISTYLEAASGILISGGPDVNPALYDREEDTSKCEGIDFRRDTLEMKMIQYAMKNNIPLMCICRGEQILNVVNGGSLIVDIPSDFDSTIIHRGSAYHWVSLTPGSILHDICKVEGDSVNSYHHQAVDLLAPGFQVIAHSKDGLTEAITLKDPGLHPFLLGVQWHPEAMDPSSPLAGPIAKRFISEVKKIQR